MKHHLPFTFLSSFHKLHSPNLINLPSINNMFISNQSQSIKSNHHIGIMIIIINDNISMAVSVKKFDDNVGDDDDDDDYFKIIIR